MMRQDATELATEISQTWPRGIATHVWEDILHTDYSDPQRARKAVKKMQRTVTGMASVAHFHDAYLATPAIVVHGHEETVCGDCGNDGWITAPDETHNGHTYTTVKPCGHCRHGRKAQSSSAWKARHIETDNQHEEHAA